MCSIRKAAVFTLAVGLTVFAGCQRVVPPAVISPVNNPPMAIDQATQIRNYDQSTSYYASGAAVAGGTGYLWQTHETIPDGYRRYTDVPVAAANIVSMPVGIFIESPWEKQLYRGESVPPTYTAQPPLP
jgi:hypothetical protein